MTMPTLLCGGRPLPLAERIGRGGEGDIFALADGSARAIKVYHHPDRDREAKVIAIIARSLGAQCANVAFPLDVVRFKDGRFAGFTMQRVEGHQPIHELITPASRRDHFPEADFRFLVHVAGNVARIVASLHAARVVIGDINTSGFLVSPRGTVTLIDADSLQIDTHRCRVGMPEFTPPELQGLPFGAIDRTADHDAFGLAVILFELLALGRHPYAGIARGKTLPLEQAIVQGRFAYSLLRNASAAPPPAALRLDELPRAIRLLFERAFAGRGFARPIAAEWVAALGKMARGIVPCPRVSNHYVAVEAAPCPWCRIERETGRAIFANGVAPPPLPRPRRDSAMHVRAAETIRHAKRHAGEAIMPMWSRPDASPSKGARRALDALGTTAMPLHPSLRAYHFGQPVLEKYGGRLDVAGATLTQALDTWRTRLGVWEIAKLVDRLRRSLDTLARLDADRSWAIARMAAQLRSNIAVDLLAQETIAAARIPGIGTALKAHLVANGIASAADISRPALSAIGGIGEARIVSLLFWAERLAVRADDVAGAKDRDTVAASAAAAVEHYRRSLEDRIEALCGEIDTRVARVRKAVSLVDREVEAALAALDQAKVDLDHLGLTGLDSSTFRAAVKPTKPVPKPTRKTAKKQARRACPRCGAPMVARWGKGVPGKQALFLGCTRYPGCAGSAPLKQKGVKS